MLDDPMIMLSSQWYFLYQKDNILMLKLASKSENSLLNVSDNLATQYVYINTFIVKGTGMLIVDLKYQSLISIDFMV